MLISYKGITSTFIYNRTYARSSAGAKNLEIILSRETEKSVSAAELKDFFTQVSNAINNGYVIEVQDPMLINLLEPKSGATVHNRLNELKAKHQQLTSEIIGTTVPPETINGYKILVLGSGYTATIEGIAQWIMDALKDKISQVSVSDGNVTAVVNTANI